MQNAAAEPSEQLDVTASPSLPLADETQGTGVSIFVVVYAA